MKSAEEKVKEKVKEVINNQFKNKTGLVIPKLILKPLQDWARNEAPKTKISSSQE